MISAKNIMIKYLDEQEKGINSVRDKIQKNDNLNLNANSFLDKAQQVDMANNFKNELEINTLEEEKEDSEIKTNKINLIFQTRQKNVALK